MATKAFLQKAYLAYFGRPADPSGLRDFAASTEAQVADAFAASAESKALYGSTFGLEQINAIYLALFNRAAEPSGLLHWKDMVNEGKITAAGAAIAILNGALGDDKIVAENKLAASALFTDALDTSAEMLGYSGSAAAAAARSFLSSVTTTAATPAAVNAAVASAVAAKDGVAGQAFTLIAAQETITSGSGNNVFNSSPALGQFGQYVDTYSTDILDGGDGIDTLNITATGVGFLNASNIENVNINALDAGNLAGVAIVMSNVTGVDTLTYTAVTGMGNTAVLADVKEVFDVVYKNNSNASDLDIQFDPNKVDGTTDSLNLRLENNLDGGTLTVNGIETVNITSVGDNFNDLSAPGATVNISGDGTLDLAAADVTEINNTATSAVILSALLATEVNNSGTSLTVNLVATKATVTNSGAGDLVYNDNSVADVALVNSGAGDLTVKATGSSTTAGTLETSIANSGAGTTTVEASEATLLEVSAGTLDIADDAFATAAIVNATGGSLIMEATDFGATIDASEGDATVDLTINDSNLVRTAIITLTGGTGDVTVKLDAVGAILATDVLTGGTAADSNDVIEFSANGKSAFTNFAGVTEFETLLYTYAGTASGAVAWSALDALEDTIVLEFGSVVGDAVANGSAGTAGTGATAVGATGGFGANGGATAASAPTASLLDLSGATATINIRLTEDLSSVGGNGGAGGAGGVAFVGINASATAAAIAGSDGGAGGDGSAGATGGSIIVTDAVTLTLELNGVTLDSSGGIGGAGGAGAAGGNGGNGMPSGTANNDGADGGDGANGGVGGAGGDAEDTISATAATSVTIYSNVSDASDTNELVAAGGLGGAGGAFGLGGSGGLATASGASAGVSGDNGTSGATGATGDDASGLAVGEAATITVTGAGNLILGVITEGGTATGLTINANDADLGAMTGDLTFEIAGTLDDDITGGEGANTITLNGGADTIDLSASADVADSITLNAAAGTSLVFDILGATAAEFNAVEITGFDLGLDTVTVTSAISAADTNIQLVAADLNINTLSGYDVYEYSVTDGVVVIGKGVNDPGVSAYWTHVTTPDEAAGLFDDVVAVIFNDVLDNSGLSSALSGYGESVVWNNGDDAWLFVSDGIGGYLANSDYVVKLVGVEVTDIADVLA
jgi:hypothetical protein